MFISRVSQTLVLYTLAKPFLFF